jgi:dUTP pyrophosphatase
VTVHDSTKAQSIRIQRLPNGVGIQLPTYMTPGSAGADVYAAVDTATTIAPRLTVRIRTGLAMQIPEGFEVQIRPRSSLALAGITVINAPGTIDSDFRGELCVLLINHGETDFIVNRGDRIAQLVVAPVLQVIFEEVSALDPSVRGAGGFGSTD